MNKLKGDKEEIVLGWTGEKVGVEWVEDRRRRPYGSMTFIVRGPDDEVEGLKNDFFKKYPPQGYGGSVKKIEDGVWQFYTSLCCD